MCRCGHCSPGLRVSEACRHRLRGRRKLYNVVWSGGPRQRLAANLSCCGFTVRRHTRRHQPSSGCTARMLMAAPSGRCRQSRRCQWRASSRCLARCIRRAPSATLHCPLWLLLRSQCRALLAAAVCTRMFLIYFPPVCMFPSRLLRPQPCLQVQSSLVVTVPWHAQILLKLSNRRLRMEYRRWRCGSCLRLARAATLVRPCHPKLAWG